MDLRPTQKDESPCHPEPFAVTLSEAKGLQFACSGYNFAKDLQFHSQAKMQMLRFAQHDSAIYSQLQREEGKR